MKKDFIYILVIVLLLIIGTCAINKCSDYKHEYNSYIAITNDTIKYYKATNGQLVATKKLYETDIKHLKYLNDSLYESLKNMKVKNVVSAANVSTTIINKIVDTCYIIKPVDMVHGITERFKIEDQYRLLSGKISYHPDTLELKIDSDKVNINYTIAIDSKNRLYIHSDNPYINYNSFSGFTLPKQKTKHWNIGPFVGASVDVTNGKINPSVGVGLQYSLIRF